MTVQRIRFEGPAEFAVHVATQLADAEGVDLISSKPPSIVDDDTVELDLQVEGAPDLVADAVSKVRGGIPTGASLEIIAD